MARTKTVRKEKKKLSEIPTRSLVDDLAGDKPKKNLLSVGEDLLEGTGIDTPAGDETLSENETIDPSASSGISREDKTQEQAKEDELTTLRKEIETNLPIAVRADADWTAEAKEDIAFCLGEQWEEQDKTDLKAQNRPCMVFNKIKPMVQLVTGHLIQTKARIQAFPEGGEDEKFTGVMDKAIDHIEKTSFLNFKLSYLFSGGEKAGKNWIEFHIDYDGDPIFGQLKIPNLGPFKVFMDPSGEEYDLSDCGFGFKVQKITKARLKQLYPEKDTEIDQFADDALASYLTAGAQSKNVDGSDYGNSDKIAGTGPTSDQDLELTGDQKLVTTVEYWKRAYVNKWFVYFVEDGAVEEYDTEEEAKSEISRRQKMKHDKMMQEHMALSKNLQGMKMAVATIAPHVSTPPPVDDVQIPEAPKLESVKIEFAIKKRRVQKMKVAVAVGSIFLTDGLQDSPFEPNYSGFGFFRYIAEWSPEAEQSKLKYQGMVRSLKDPQREKNKSKSQFLHILNTSGNSGWKGDDDAMSEEKWKELKNFGATPGIIVRHKKGAELDRIHPVEPSVAMQVREKSADDSFKECSGLNADLLAIDNNSDPSGKAIALRIRQAITILQPSFENFRYTKILIGQFLFSIIPTLFDSAKLEKVLGSKFMKENQLTRTILDAYLTIIKDMKYNVQISEAGAPDTIREETFEDLMSLAQAGVSMPPELYVEYMNMPNKQEVINKVKEWSAAQAQMMAAKKAGVQ